MDIYALSAGLLAIAVALVHSLLGEKLIFSRMRESSIVPTSGQPVLRERHVRILWATWHLVSIMGIAFGAMLIHAAQPHAELPRFVLITIVVTMVLSGALVLYATKGKHPGWVGLLGVAILTWLYVQG